MWYAYFLQLENGDLNVGSTDDFRRRMASHERGQVTSTKAHLSATLKSNIAVQTADNARQLEIYFKTGSGKALANKRFW